MHTAGLGPFAEKQADALAIMRPPNALGNCWANVDRLELGDQFLVFVLRDCVGDLSEKQGK
jgi:hypothetical protein